RVEADRARRPRCRRASVCRLALEGGLLAGENLRLVRAVADDDRDAFQSQARGGHLDRARSVIVEPADVVDVRVDSVLAMVGAGDGPHGHARGRLVHAGRARIVPGLPGEGLVRRRRDRRVRRIGSHVGSACGDQRGVEPHAREREPPVVLHLRVGQGQRCALLPRALERERARDEDGEQGADPDGEQHHRDDQLDQPERLLLAAKAPQPGRQGDGAGSHGYLSCCHDPGTLLHPTWSSPWTVVVVVIVSDVVVVSVLVEVVVDVVVEVVTPGAPAGGLTVFRSFAFPDIVAVSAITGPLIVAPLAALKFLFVNAMPSKTAAPLSVNPSVAFPASIATSSSRSSLGSKLPLQGLPLIARAQTFVPLPKLIVPLT